MDIKHFLEQNLKAYEDLRLKGGQCRKEYFDVTHQRGLHWDENA